MLTLVRWRTLAGALVAVSVIDAWTTAVLIDRGHVEQNALMRDGIETFGMLGVGMLRVAAGAVIALVLAWCARKLPRHRGLTVGAGFVILTWWTVIALNNVRWL